MVEPVKRELSETRETRASVCETGGNRNMRRLSLPANVEIFLQELVAIDKSYLWQAFCLLGDSPSLEVGSRTEKPATIYNGQRPGPVSSSTDPLLRVNFGDVSL
jgi:hypothetical protein